MYEIDLSQIKMKYKMGISHAFRENAGYRNHSWALFLDHLLFLHTTTKEWCQEVSRGELTVMTKGLEYL